jgi:hypothetical protein
MAWSGQAPGRWTITLVFQSTTRAASLIRRSRSVAGSDHQHPEAHDVGDAVHDTPRRPRISHTGGQPVGNAKAGFDLPKGQHAPVRYEPPAIEASDDRPAGDR